MPVTRDRKLGRGGMHQRCCDGEIGERQPILRDPLLVREMPVEHIGGRSEQGLATRNLGWIRAAGAADHLLRHPLAADESDRRRK